MQNYRESEEASPIADVMLTGIGKGQKFAAETIRKLAAARSANLNEKP
ncbi:MAG: hypothetical protein KGJ13_12395 [Patescibacteria group bacterium]|nr:hypothetical protein [Patescibacteria group bacterium]